MAERLRSVLLAVTVIASLALCGVRLMTVQIVDGEEYLRASKTSVEGLQTIQATRGEIVDVNGLPIIQNKVGFNVIIQKAFFPTDLQKSNEIILQVARLLEKDGLNWVDTIPVTKTLPYSFLRDQDRAVQTMKSSGYLRLAPYATADDCINALITRYDISDAYTPEEQRVIAGVRYEMMLKSFSISTRYTFAEDIPIETVVKLRELSYQFPGVYIQEEAIREVVQGDILPQSLGTLGPIYAEEEKLYTSQGYQLTDIVGKSGIEKSMEPWLRGQNGTQKITITDGVALSPEVVQEAIPGKSIKLTIDSEYQRKLDAILASQIAWLQTKTTQKEGMNANAGALVVLNAKTGAVLGLSNFPTYNLNDYLDNYSSVASREDFPLINRSVDGLYRPGSTFKPITATAALNENIIDGSSTVVCSGIYRFFPDYQPGCTGVHGSIGVSRALQVSCNSFFYDVGRRVGIHAINEYAAYYGLGQDLKMEIPTSVGRIANPDVLGADWTPGAVIQASIGQSETAVSPLQMAVQAMTLANRGVRYQPFLVEGIYSYDFSQVVKQTEKQIVSEIPIRNNEMYDLIEAGMIAAANASAPAEYSLSSLPGQAAIKTGTPQTGADKQTTSSAFVGYYPVGDPELAFAGYIENGEYSKYMIRKLINAYYGWDAESTEPVKPTGTDDADRGETSAVSSSSAEHPVSSPTP